MRSPAVFHSQAGTADTVGHVGVGSAVLLAALLHAVWNAVVHRIPDRVIGLALIGVGYTVVAAAVVPWVAVPDVGAWGWLLGSVVLHVVYSVLLIRSYRLGEFGQVYPLARGVSPIVVVVVAVTLVGQPLGYGQVLGVGVL